MLEGYRIFILGAGFSRPAGLPLGAELFAAVRKRARSVCGADNHLERDLSRFIEYKCRCDGIDLIPDAVDFEELLAYLDIEHFLELRGSDTWSRDGNQGQVIVKRLIGQIIHERTPPPTNLPDLYLQFAERLHVTDIVLTFNYDTLLETALEQVGKPYRLFLHRFSRVEGWANTIDGSREEVVVLKMHGSIDWFDRTDHEELVRQYQAQGPSDLTSYYPVFADPSTYQPEPILDGPRSPDDPLRKMCRIRRGVDGFYADHYPPQTPWILSPSHSKVVYASTLRDHWHGLGRAGGMTPGLAVIGYSMPSHDGYVRQAMYHLARNYQELGWDDDLGGSRKATLKVVDFRPTPELEADLRNRYRFIDWTRADLHLGGLTTDALDAVFAAGRA